MHHGGEFVDGGGTMFYIGGTVIGKHNYDADVFGYFDLRDEIKDLGYESWKYLAYKVPGHADVFKEIYDDKETTEMITLTLSQPVKICNVYVDSGKKKEFEDIDGEMDHVVDLKGKSIADDESYDDTEYMVDMQAIDDDSDESVTLEEEVLGSEGDDEEYIQAVQNIRKEKKVGRNVEGSATGGNEDSSSFVLDQISTDDGEDSEQILSEYGESDDAMYDTSDEEGEYGRRTSNKVYYDPKCDHKQMELVKGMRFEDGIQCRDALRTWAILQGHPIRFRRVSKDQLQAKCAAPCLWKCYGSVNSSEKNFVIRTLKEPHTYSFSIHNKVANYKWIARQYIEVFRVRSDMSISEFLEDCNNKLGIQPSRGRLYRAKAYALELLRGTVKHHYGILRSYIAELIRVDREGRFELMLGDEALFKGLYIGFSSLKRGFMAGCRWIIGLDGYHLKTHLGGQLLCATGTDANNQMFPVAWTVVAVENEFYWSWFLKILLEELGIRDGNGVTFMSDQQKV